jgi:hypothetical protein
MNDYEIILYENIEVRVDNAAEPWLTRGEMAAMLDVDVHNVAAILNSAYERGDLSENTRCKESIHRNNQRHWITRYNLDAILMVGFRSRASASDRVIAFRQWIANIVRGHIHNLQYDRDEYRDRVLELEQRLADTQQDLSDAQGEVYSLYYDIEEI